MYPVSSHEPIALCLSISRILGILTVIYPGILALTYPVSSQEPKILWLSCTSGILILMHPVDFGSHVFLGLCLFSTLGDLAVMYPEPQLCYNCMWLTGLKAPTN